MAKTHAIIFWMNDGTLKTVYCNMNEIHDVMQAMKDKYRKSILKQNILNY